MFRLSLLARSVMNLFLYAVTVLIWGTTWIAIKWQLGVVPPPVSIAWRFWLAALVLFALLRLMRRPIWPPRAAWRFLVAQGLALFCLNFLCFYYAEQVVPSGLVAVVFSIAPLLNSINGRLFMGRPLQPTAIAGALLGLVGIVCLFVQQMAGHLGDPRSCWVWRSRSSAPCASPPAICCRAGCNRWGCIRSPPIAGRC